MELNTVASQPFSPKNVGIHQTQQSTTATNATSKTPDKAKEQGGPAPVQDHVTLSKQAQALATSTSPTAKNNTFQQSPSPFDR